MSEAPEQIWSLEKSENWEKSDWEPTPRLYIRVDRHATAIREAVEAERERCARIAFKEAQEMAAEAKSLDCGYARACRATAEDIAAAIRTPDSEEQR